MSDLETIRRALIVATAFASELQEILDFDVENGIETDCAVQVSALPGCIDVYPFTGQGRPFAITKREACVLAARLLRAAAQ